jgi:hypothetical protein
MAKVGTIKHVFLLGNGIRYLVWRHLKKYIERKKAISICFTILLQNGRGWNREGKLT